MNNDLISRSALKKEFNLNFGGVSHAVIAGRIIDNAPAVDAIEVCRCKDCKWRNTRGCWYHSPNCAPRDDNDFCSDGERREDG